MKENYYALLICILRKDYDIDRSIKAMVEGRISNTMNTAIKREDVQDMLSMKRQGLTYIAIGQMYGLTKQAVYRRLKRYKEKEVIAG